MPRSSALFRSPSRCAAWIGGGSVLLLALALALLSSPANSIASTPPASCSDIQAANASAADGTYTVTVGGIPISVYCADMAATPGEYISLVQTGSGENFSQSTAGGVLYGTNVVTHYMKLRINPIPVSMSPLTFAVNVADQTFSSSSGSQQQWGEGDPTTSMPYGAAAGCNGSANGLANLDLRGTPFGVVNNFALGGFMPAGSTTYVTPQVVNLTGGGWCGWNAPATVWGPGNTNQLTDSNGGYDLQIYVLGPAYWLPILQPSVIGVGPGTSLADKLQQAEAYVSAQDLTGACGTLNAFILQVKAQSGRSIPASTASTLIAAVQRIEALTPC